MEKIIRVYFKGKEWNIFRQDYEHIDWDEIENSCKVFWYKFLYATQLDEKQTTKDCWPNQIQKAMEN